MSTTIIREIKAKYGEEREIKMSVHNPVNVARFFAFLQGEVQENFYILCLDNQNKPLAYSRVALGSSDEMIIHPRDVFRNALLSNASWIILVHNHPSNSLEFSSEDYQTTKRLIEAGKLLGVPVIDHVLVTDSCHRSMREEGAIDF